MIPMSFPVTMEDVCQISSSVMTLMTVETTVMKRTVVCMWCGIWFNDPAPFRERLLVNPASIYGFQGYYSGIIIVAR